MGQMITVTTAPSADKNTLIFQLNRSLTGMEILNYDQDTQIPESEDPSNIAAKKLIDLGAKSVSIYSNVVTVTSDESTVSSKQNEMIKALENLYIYYSENLKS